MIHPKTPPAPRSRQRKKRSTNSGRTLIGSAETIQLDGRATPKVPKDVQEPNDALGFFELLEQEKAEAEMAKMLEQKKLYPIAPDALIPNSTIRAMFKIKQLEPVEAKMFRLRLIPPPTANTIENELNERIKRYSVLTNFDGIHSTIFPLLNKINKTNKNLNWQNDDDEWVELGDPEASFVETTSRPASAKKSRTLRPTTGTLISRQQDTIPELFKRMKNESWWQQIDDEENNNLRSMLLYLIEILKAKQSDSYESACNYVVEIFRTYGVEPSLVNQILNILMDHLTQGENDPLDIFTVRTMAQFMIERKNIIISLLDFTLKYQPDNQLRQEAINAVKFITDVNSSDDIDLVLDNMPVVRDAAEDTFSLKTIIERIKHKQKQSSSDLTNEGDGEKSEGDTLHPLLKKISEERWFPRDNNPITLDSIIDAILAKLPNASKSMIKTLTTHLVQLHRTIGYSNEQFDRVANGLITLLSHNDADYRLIAGTILGELGKETKAIDIALLNSFINDPRILVRTECCDTLKKLTGIMSDTVLKDCAEDIPHLQTLPEEDFSLQNYLKEKNRVPTPPPTTTTIIDEPPSVVVDEKQEGEETGGVGDEKQEEDETGRVGDENEEEEVEKRPLTDENEQEKSDVNIEDSTYPPINDQIDKTDNVTSFVHSRSPSPRVDGRPSTDTNRPAYQQTPSQFSITPSGVSSTAPITPIEPSIRVEINEKPKPNIPPSEQVPKSRRDVPPPPPPSTHTPRLRKQPTITIDQHHHRSPVKTVVSDQSSGKGSLLLPNTTNMWDSYAKQNETDEQTNVNVPPSTEINQDQTSDAIQTILDDHKHNIGYYRMIPKRPVLVPHKISIGDVFGDQSHITVDRKTPFSSTFQPSTMQLSDLNRNKHHLNEVEFVQLLSSLVIRSIQIHKKHERFIRGPFSTNTDSSTSFTDALSISQMQLHSSTGFSQSNFFTQTKLPPIPRERPSSPQMARMRTDAHHRAARAGINLRKAKDMEDALSTLLKSDRDRDQTRSTLQPSNTPHPPTEVSVTDHNEVTHAWLLEQLLKSQGTPDSQRYIQQISRAYPKFAPLLHSRIPQNLIPTIWNDRVMNQLASIIGNKQDESSTATDGLSVRGSNTKPTAPAFDDEHSLNFFDYASSSQLLAMQQQQRDDQKKKFLPHVRGAKLPLPRHVLKFGFRELEAESPEASLVSLRDESTSKSRRRRIYMHLMMSVNQDMYIRHELVKSQYRQMLKTDYQTTTYLPFIKRAPMCN